MKTRNNRAHKQLGPPVPCWQKILCMVLHHFQCHYLHNRFCNLWPLGSDRTVKHLCFVLFCLRNFMWPKQLRSARWVSFHITSWFMGKHPEVNRYCQQGKTPSFRRSHSHASFNDYRQEALWGQTSWSITESHTRTNLPLWFPFSHSSFQFVCFALWLCFRPHLQLLPLQT